MTPRDRVDTIIDHAASRMVQATPSDALRANVMSRISVEKPSRFAWRFAFAGGAIATVALVAFLSWPSKHTILNSPIADAKVGNFPIVDSSMHPTVALNSTSPLTSVARTVAANGSGELVVASLSDADQEWLSRRVPALEHPELMTPVKPLLEGAPIKAIDVEPMRVAPLVVPAIGDDNQ